MRKSARLVAFLLGALIAIAICIPTHLYLQIAQMNRFGSPILGDLDLAQALGIKQLVDKYGMSPTSTSKTLTASGVTEYSVVNSKDEELCFMVVQPDGVSFILRIRADYYSERNAISVNTLQFRYNELRRAIKGKSVGLRTKSDNNSGFRFGRCYLSWETDSGGHNTKSYNSGNQEWLMLMYEAK